MRIDLQTKSTMNPKWTNRTIEPGDGVWTAGDKSICQIDDGVSSHHRLIIGLLSEPVVELTKQNSGNTFDVVDKVSATVRHTLGRVARWEAIRIGTNDG